MFVDENNQCSKVLFITVVIIISIQTLHDVTCTILNKIQFIFLIELVVRFHLAIVFSALGSSIFSSIPAISEAASAGHSLHS